METPFKWPLFCFSEMKCCHRDDKNICRTLASVLFCGATFFSPCYFLHSCKTEANLFLIAISNQKFDFYQSSQKMALQIQTTYLPMAFSQKKEKVTQTPKPIKVTGQSFASSLCVFAHKLKAAIPIPVYLTVMNHRWNSL